MVYHAALKMTEMSTDQESCSKCIIGKNRLQKQYEQYDLIFKNSVKVFSLQTSKCSRFGNFLFDKTTGGFYFFNLILLAVPNIMLFLFCSFHLEYPLPRPSDPTPNLFLLLLGKIIPPSNQTGCSIHEYL